ncbi:MAG: hypothetical protein ACREQ5_15265 [Candidatus Dormibacteria bacterium]
MNTQHVPAATRRFRRMRRTAIALGMLEAAKRKLRPVAERSLRRPEPLSRDLAPGEDLLEPSSATDFSPTVPERALPMSASPETTGPLLPAVTDAVIRTLVRSEFLRLGKEPTGKKAAWTASCALDFLIEHGWDGILERTEGQLRKSIEIKAERLARNLVISYLLQTRPPRPENPLEPYTPPPLEIPSDPLLRNALRIGLLLAPDAIALADGLYDPEFWLTSEDELDVVEQEVNELRELLDLLRWPKRMGR